jgi:hypothetical protein
MLGEWECALERGGRNVDMTHLAATRPSKRDVKIVSGLSAAVFAAPLALSAAVVMASGTTGTGARRPSLLVSEAVAAPAREAEARGFAANPQAPDLLITAPSRRLALGETILPPAFVARRAVAPAAEGAAPAPRSFAPLMQAQLRLLARGAPMPRARALDGLRIESEGLIVRLAGLDDLPADAVCKRLDGVAEPCRARATGRLAVLLHGREVVCRISALAGEAEAIGQCSAGKIDLAEDLARQGLAQRAGATRTAGRGERAL